MNLQQSIRKILSEEAGEQKVLVLPGLSFFGENPQDAWDNMQKLLKLKGYPPYSVRGNLYLYDTPIESLGNLISVGGDLDLRETSIESLGNLESVGGSLDLSGTKIKSLGNLESVGGDLYLEDTPLAKMYSENQIREMINVGGEIFFE